VMSIGQRVGIHVGRFLSADVGTPRRMDHVLLGSSVHTTKESEGAGVLGRVNLTKDAYERVKDQFRFEEGTPGYMLVIDDLDDKDLGSYDVAVSRRRPSSVLFERSIPALVVEIERLLDEVEPLAAFIPDAILAVMVENAAERQLPTDFPTPTVMFVNVIGPPEAVDGADEDSVHQIVVSFSRLVARINAAVEKHGGVLTRVTYHLVGSDLLILFGVPNAHTDDPLRAATAALEIRRIIEGFEPPIVNGLPVETTCQIGMNIGPTFSGEIGEPRGRRSFNIQGDAVNVAARLMGKAVGNRILVSESLAALLDQHFALQSMGSLRLKGKSDLMKLFALNGPLDTTP
jgi:adenylate cyclase